MFKIETKGKDNPVARLIEHHMINNEPVDMFGAKWHAMAVDVDPTNFIRVYHLLEAYDENKTS